MDRRGQKGSRLKEFVANPRKGLWSLAVPMMFGMAIQTAYMVVDMIFVGRVGGSALAAVQFNGPLVFFSLGIVFGLGTGITAVVAQFIGSGDKFNADNSAEHAVILGLLFGLLFTGVGLTWGKKLLTTMGVSPEILPLAWSYFQVIALGYIFMVMSVFFRSILTGEGDVKTPVMIQAVGTVINIILDPIFIFGLDMGVQGAAVATVTSQVTVSLVFVYLLFVKQHAYVTFALRNFSFSGRVVGKIFKIGVPASFSMIIMSVGGGAFNRILVSFSEDAVAAYGVGSRLDHMFLLPAISISASLVTLVGMFYGAQRMDLVRQVIYYGMSRSASIGVGLGTIFFVFAHPIISVFTDNASIVGLGAEYVRIIVFSYPFIAISMTSGRVLQGLGFGMPMLVITFLRVLLISVALAYVFVFWMNRPVQWVWVAMVISVFCSATLASVWLRFGLGRVREFT